MIRIVAPNLGMSQVSPIPSSPLTAMDDLVEWTAVWFPDWPQRSVGGVTE
jgi:hypothetical protein